MLLKNSEDALANANQKIESIEKEKEDLTKQIHDSTENVTYLQSEVDRVQILLNTSEDFVSDLEAKQKQEISTISSVLDRAVTNIGVLKNMIKTKNIELDKAKSEIVSLKLEKSTMKDNLDKIYIGEVEQGFLAMGKKFQKKEDKFVAQLKVLEEQKLLFLAQLEEHKASSLPENAELCEDEETVDWNSYTVSQLKTIAYGCLLQKTGTKDELIERIRSHEKKHPSDVMKQRDLCLAYEKEANQSSSKSSRKRK